MEQERTPTQPRTQEDPEHTKDAQRTARHTRLPSREVIVTDVKMPFGSMVTFLVKWTIASIPALIILSLLLGVILAVLGGIFGGLISGF